MPDYLVSLELHSGVFNVPNYSGAFLRLQSQIAQLV